MKIKELFTVSLIVIGIVLGFVQQEQVKGDRYTYQAIQISAGDTLWSLASTHGSNKEDIRKTIHRIQSKNNLNHQSHLQPGQTIYIPVPVQDKEPLLAL